MIIFFARYAFLFSFFISSNAEKVHTLQMESQNQDLYNTAACTAKCLDALPRERDYESYGHPSQQRQMSSSLQDCFDVCQYKNGSLDSVDSIKSIQENLSLKLVCRDDKSLTFRIDLEPIGGIPESNNLLETTPLENTPNIVYVIKIYVSQNAEVYDVFLTDENVFSISDLKSNTAHTVTVVAMHGDGVYSVVTKEEQFSTLKRGFTPGMVTNIQVTEFKVDKENDMRLRAKIIWTPSSDMTCHYNIIYFSPDEGYDLTPLEIRNPRLLYSYHLENLRFSATYNVGIRAKNPNNISKESELFWRAFDAPTCVDWFNYNFNVCAPLPPQSLTVDQTFIGNDKFLFNISWTLPKYLPEFYTLRILDLAQNGSQVVRNVSKDLCYVSISDLTIRGIMYEVHLTAYSLGGSSSSVFTDLTKRVLVLSGESHIVKLVSAILVPIFSVVVLSLTTFIVCHRRARLKRYQERCKYFEGLEKKAPNDPKGKFELPSKNIMFLKSAEDVIQYQNELVEKTFLSDSMEISRQDIVLYELLGEGAFGLVRRGIYNDHKLGPLEVAVKMLKDQPTAEDIRGFRREIEVMKSVEKHSNVVGLIGHCTLGCREMLLLTEFCSFGNLLDFLRKEWHYLNQTHFNSSPSVMSENHVNDKIKLNYNSNSESNECSSNYTSFFNFDKSVIEKFKAKYTNLATTHFRQKKWNGPPNSGTTNTQTLHMAEEITDLSEATILTKTSENKSYGHNDTCTNSCRCEVSVIINNIDPSFEVDKRSFENRLQSSRTEESTIEIRNCECKNILRLTERNGKNFIAVENKSYFDYPSENINMAKVLHKDNDETIPLESFATREPLKATDLLDIAKQVAVGMEFLAKNKVVHRDLAARNVLVASDRSVKIADFGLSRDIYQENIYKKTGNGKLPIKWLALECLTHQVYTTQSDVWSYGILLYEIVTLGGIPYPSVPTNRLLHLLKTGYRMEKPANCGQRFYQLMHSCWHVNPNDRPNFTEVIKIIASLMTDEPEQEILNNHDAAKARKQNTSIEDPYLKPL